MSLEQMEFRLTKWQALVWACLGAAGGQLLSSVADALQPRRQIGLDQYLSWLWVWIIVQTLAVAPAVVLILHRDWRSLPLSLRLRCVFGSIAAAWMALFSFGLRLRSGLDFAEYHVVIPLLILGAVLTWIYIRLRNQLFTAPEAMFP
ncbi:MAG: hypothetical protein JW929_07845 [Anaerolineales bacterium]|nr:hypothetical protein [Anaerolineales bacterium]